MAKNELVNSANIDLSPIVKRLDVLINLVIEANSDKSAFSFTNIVPLINKIGLEPLEIAHILGKTRASDLSQYLYGKPKKSNK